MSEPLYRVSIGFLLGPEKFLKEEVEFKTGDLIGQAFLDQFPKMIDFVKPVPYEITSSQRTVDTMTILYNPKNNHGDNEEVESAEIPSDFTKKIDKQKKTDKK